MLRLYSICFIQWGSDSVHNLLTEATGFLAAVLLELHQNCWQATSVQLVIGYLERPQPKYINGWVDRIHKKKRHTAEFPPKVLDTENKWLCEKERSVFSWPNSKHAAEVTEKEWRFSHKKNKKKNLDWSTEVNALSITVRKWNYGGKSSHILTRYNCEETATIGEVSYGNTGSQEMNLKAGCKICVWLLMLLFLREKKKKKQKN